MIDNETYHASNIFGGLVGLILVELKRNKA